MMMSPLGNLLQKVDCRYTLVIVAAKRARMLVEHKQVSSLDQYNPEDNSQRPVEVAIREILDGRLTAVKSSAASRKEADELQIRREYEIAALQEAQAALSEEDRD